MTCGDFHCQNLSKIAKMRFSTSISNTQIQSGLKNIIRRCYSKTVLGRDYSYLVKKIPNHLPNVLINYLPNIPKKMFSKCFNFWSTTYLSSVVDAFFLTNCRHSNGNQLCSSTLAYSFTLISDLIQRKKQRLARSFELSFCYIDVSIIAKQS